MNSTAQTLRQKAAWAAFRRGGPLLAAAYRAVEPALRRHTERTNVTGYDVASHGFAGGELETLTRNNYEKSLRNLWKAEMHAPYLGFKDANKNEKMGAQVDEEQAEINQLMEIATSEQTKAEFEAAFTPEQREAIGRIMSLIAHGEAYALYTSSTLLPVLTGTGAKLGMAMQVMEEAKHFMVLREMLRTLEIDYPLYDSGYILFESIAKAPPYRKLFGMNVMLESFATSIFAQFADFPGLKHIVHVFHMDEARHCAYPKSYAKSGAIPRYYSESTREKLGRTALLLPVLPLVFDYKPHFEALDMDAFAFFGRVISKVAKLADDSGLGFIQPREEAVAGVNLLFNAYRATFEPDRFDGYRDYSALKEGEVRSDLIDREVEVFGEIFGRRQAAS